MKNQGGGSKVADYKDKSCQNFKNYWTKSLKTVHLMSFKTVHNDFNVKIKKNTMADYKE